MTSVGAEMIVSQHPKWLYLRTRAQKLAHGTRAAETAQHLVRHFNVSDVPVHVMRIVRGLEVHVEAGNIEGAVETRVEPVEELLGDTFKATILVNRWHPVQIQRYAVAHGLGHILFHEFANSAVRYRDSRDFPSLTGIEREANRFAVELLMPEHLVRHQMRIASTLSRNALPGLAVDFDVSEAQMDRRLREFYEFR